MQRIDRCFCRAVKIVESGALVLDKDFIVTSEGNISPPDIILLSETHRIMCSLSSIIDRD